MAAKGFCELAGWARCLRTRRGTARCHTLHTLTVYRGGVSFHPPLRQTLIPSAPGHPLPLGSMNYSTGFSRSPWALGRAVHNAAPRSGRTLHGGRRTGSRPARPRSEGWFPKTAPFSLTSATPRRPVHACARSGEHGWCLQPSGARLREQTLRLLIPKSRGFFLDGTSEPELGALAMSASPGEAAGVPSTEGIGTRVRTVGRSPHRSHRIGRCPQTPETPVQILKPGRSPACAGARAQPLPCVDGTLCQLGERLTAGPIKI